MKTEIKEEYLGGYRKETLRHDLVAMEIACISSKESKDPSTQVGACILGNDDRVLSTGFNHNPTNWDSSKFPWRNDLDIIGNENTKYPYIIHAELDAISRCSNLSELKNGTIYVTLFPCTQCAKTIVSFGIKKVVYAEYRESKDAICAKRLLEESGVEVVQFNKIIEDNNEISKQPPKKIKLNLKKKEI